MPMATIQKRLSKSGKPSYLIKVSLGYDDFGKQKIKSFTYKPDKDMSETRRALVKAYDRLR